MINNKINVYCVNSFTHQDKGGNPAGVVLDADALTQQQMQNIATQVGYSETAFVSKGLLSSCDFTVQFFTPNAEVDFCGHATLATFLVLFQQDIIKAGVYRQQTKAGKLAVKVDEYGFIEMNQALPTFLGEIPKKEIAQTLNIDEQFLCFDQLPIEITSTGLADIIIPVVHGKLDSIKPNFSAIATLCEKYNAIGYHLFEISDTKSEFSLSCRNFAPLVEIDEESATGSACGALGCYLVKHQVFSSQGIIQDNAQVNTQANTQANVQYSIEQGRQMKCRSKLNVEIENKNNEFISVKVGGMASIFDQIVINV
jgi:PhzF family phenazine biosynthesis protein